MHKLLIPLRPVVWLSLLIAATRLAFTGVAGFLPTAASLPTLGSKLTQSGIAPLASLAPSPEELAAPSPRPPATGEKLREEIRELARKGLMDSALSLCRRALELDSCDAFARFMAGKLSPEGKASAEQFKRVLDLGKGGPEAEESRFRLGQYHYAAGKYHLAIPYFRDYLRVHPKGDWKEPSLYWMGNACHAFAASRPDRLAYLDTGLVYLRKLLDLSPPENYYHALALEGMARIRLSLGDVDEAWESVQGALDRAPEDERASILLLSAQLRRNVDRDAERKFLDRLAKEHPQSPEVRHLRRLNGGADISKWRAPAVPVAAKLPVDSAAKAEPSAVPTETAPTPAMAATASAVTTASAGTFTLQLGAFAQAGNAQGMVRELSRMGFAPELSESRRGGKAIYQVRLGRFASQAEAEEYAKTHLAPRKLMSQAVPVQ